MTLLPRLGPAAVVAAVVAAIVTVPAASRDDTPPVAQVVVHADGPGRPVPRSFVGFSIEYPSVAGYFGPPGRPNDGFLALLATLDKAQHGAPSLRIGGNSADVAAWDPSGAPQPPQIATKLGRPFLDSLRALELRLHAPLTLTLDLALQQPADALAFARAAQARLPGAALSALEIGNEPDFYSRRQPTRRGVLGPARFPALRHYSEAQYVADATAYARALDTGLPRTPKLVVGSFAGSSWDGSIPSLLRRIPPGVSRASIHAYPLLGCHARPKRGETVAALLSPAASRGLAERVAAEMRIERAPAGATRVGEMNSVSCGGLAGVSDTFASALWSTDTLFEMLRIGASGVALHTFAGAAYEPFAFTPAAATGRQVTIHPLYYGLLLFARAAPYGAHLVPVATTGADGLEVWATADRHGTVRVVAINPSMRRSRSLVVRVGAPGGSVAHFARLEAPGPAARGGVSLAGQHVGPDGRLHGHMRVARLTAVGGRYRVRLSAASAGLLTVASSPDRGRIRAPERLAAPARTARPTSRSRA